MQGGEHDGLACGRANCGLMYAQSDLAWYAQPYFVLYVISDVLSVLERPTRELLSIS